MAAYRRVYDSRHLQATAKNRDQLRNPTLGNSSMGYLFALRGYDFSVGPSTPGPVLLAAASHSSAQGLHRRGVAQGNETPERRR